MSKAKQSRPQQIAGCHVVAYFDNGQTRVVVSWADGSHTAGDFSSTHMRALVDRARREGIGVTCEVRW